MSFLLKLLENRIKI